MAPPLPLFWLFFLSSYCHSHFSSVRVVLLTIAIFIKKIIACSRFSCNRWLCLNACIPPSPILKSGHCLAVKPCMKSGLYLPPTLHLSLREFVQFFFHAIRFFRNFWVLWATVLSQKREWPPTAYMTINYLMPKGNTHTSSSYQQKASSGYTWGDHS